MATPAVVGRFVWSALKPSYNAGKVQLHSWIMPKHNCFRHSTVGRGDDNRYGGRVSIGVRDGNLPKLGDSRGNRQQSKLQSGIRTVCALNLDVANRGNHHSWMSNCRSGLIVGLEREPTVLLVIPAACVPRMISGFRHKENG